MRCKICNENNCLEPFVKNVTKCTNCESLYNMSIQHEEIPVIASINNNLKLSAQKKISKLTKLMRYPCSDALSYCQLCEGKLNVVLQCYNKIWDIHPMIPLVKNAGGYINTWKGNDPKIGGSVVVSSSSSLHRKILKMLKPVA